MRMKQFYLILPLICSVLCNCNPKTLENHPHPDLPNEGVVHEDLYTEENSNVLQQSDTLREVDPVIMATSLNGLKLIEENWTNTTLYTDASIEFLLVRPTSKNTIVAIAATPFDSEDNDSDFFFYELDLNGIVLSRTLLYSTDYSCNISQNLQEFENTIHYFRKKGSKEEWAYDLTTKSHKKSDVLLLDWVTINDWKKQQYFPSSDGSQMIQLEATNLFHIIGENKTKLISQPYDGAWSFGTGCWNSAGNTIFFDNSGAVACIWKIDLTTKTLAKIIPEHEAKSPAVMDVNGKMTLVYCEGSSIKLSSH